MTEHILLSGASGFLGKIILNHYHNLSPFIQVDTLDRSANATYKSDISTSVNPIKKKYDLVIHAAGKAHSLPKDEKEADTFFQVNFEGTKNLCNAFDPEAIPASFVFISTVAVYGIDEGINISEDYPLTGRTAYARSKIQAEEWLREWARCNNVQLAILRLPLIAGPGAPGNLGAMIEGIKRGRYLSIGKGNARKSIVWADDVASILVTAGRYGGTYNLTDGYHPSFSELEVCISKNMGKRILRIPFWVAWLLAHTGNILGRRFPINSDKLKKITSTLIFDDQKAKETLAWSPKEVIQKLPSVL